MHCKQLKLYLEFLHDLHNGQASTEQTYFNKILQNATNGGLWGDFATIFWISQYLQKPNFNNNIIQKKPAPFFYDLTFEKEQTSYNQISSNLCILSKTKRPFEQLETSLQKNSKEKKQCSNKKKLFRLKLWITLWPI